MERTRAAAFGNLETRQDQNISGETQPIFVKSADSGEAPLASNATSVITGYVTRGTFQNIFFLAVAMVSE